MLIRVEDANADVFTFASRTWLRLPRDSKESAASVLSASACVCRTSLGQILGLHWSTNGCNAWFKGSMLSMHRFNCTSLHMAMSNVCAHFFRCSATNKTSTNRTGADIFVTIFTRVSINDHLKEHLSRFIFISGLVKPDLPTVVHAS